MEPQDLAAVDAHWRAANYLSVGQIFLRDNPLLRRDLEIADVKPRVSGRWGNNSGISFVHAHTSRLIRATGQETILLAGPGHTGAALVAASWLEGTYPEFFPSVTQDVTGMRRLFRRFSTPDGVPSHASVTTPGTIHPDGELGHVLAHAFGAAMDDPDLLVVAVVGDGEAETVALEGSWKGISFLNPARDGAVLPVLDLGGWKTSGPTVLARKDPASVRCLFEGHGYHLLEVSGHDLPGMHHRFAAALDEAHERISRIQHTARAGRPPTGVPAWPLIVLRSPVGWTGPRDVDGVRVEGTWRTHRVPLVAGENPGHLRTLQDWLLSYRPGELFDADGVPTELVRRNLPEPALRLTASTRADAGLLTKDLVLPDLAGYEQEVPRPGTRRAASPRRLGEFLRDVHRANPTSFRWFCPDETTGFGLGAVLEASDRVWMESTRPGDVRSSAGGRVVEVLSGQTCHGWLQGYTRTGRHGVFATAEASAMVTAAQTVQHGDWLEGARELPWRAPVPSLNVLLTSTAWRDDRHGFGHQGPALLQTLLTRGASVARIHLPPDANSLLVVVEHCLRSRSRINVVVVDDEPQPQYLTLEQAVDHVHRGVGIWSWAGTDDGTRDPDVVLACAGDVMTTETVAAAAILRERLPQLRVRVVNVVDLGRLRRPVDHPDGMDEFTFRESFTDDVDVVFAVHGFPGVVHQLLHGRPHPQRFHVRGFSSGVVGVGSTTPFDMTVRHRVSRYHLVLDALNTARRLPVGAADLRAWCRAQLRRHAAHVVEHLEDLPEVRDWTLSLT